MSYPMEWNGSVDNKDTTGTVTFMVEGVEYKFLLDSFDQALAISRMLDAAFVQGKQVASESVRRSAMLAMDKCIRDNIA